MRPLFLGSLLPKLDDNDVKALAQIKHDWLGVDLVIT